MKIFEQGVDMDSLMEGLVVICLLAIIFGFMLGLYFLPTIIALAMHNYHALPIFLMNFFTGWTGIGWLGCLIWALV